MKFQTKMHEVDAISVERVVSLAANDFGKLPVWIKRNLMNPACSLVSII